MQEVFKKGLGTFEWGSEFWPNSHNFTQRQKTLVVSRCTHCAHRQLGYTVLATQYFRPPSEHPFTVFRYGGVSPLMFLASWLDRRCSNGREGAPLSTFFQVLTDGAERRCPSSRGQATRNDDPGQLAGTLFFTYFFTLFFTFSSRSSSHSSLLGLLVSNFKRGGVNWTYKIFANTNCFQYIRGKRTDWF